MRSRIYDLNLFERRLSDAQEVWQDDIETEFLAFRNEFIKWEDPERSASIDATFMLLAPYLYLQLALGSFVAGFAVYLWSVWNRNLGQADNVSQNYTLNTDEARNIFIVFMVSFSLLSTYTNELLSAKSWICSPCEFGETTKKSSIDVLCLFKNISQGAMDLQR